MSEITVEALEEQLKEELVRIENFLNLQAFNNTSVHQIAMLLVANVVAMCNGIYALHRCQTKQGQAVLLRSALEGTVRLAYLVDKGESAAVELVINDCEKKWIHFSTARASEKILETRRVETVFLEEHKRLKTKKLGGFFELLQSTNSIPEDIKKQLDWIYQLLCLITHSQLSALAGLYKTDDVQQPVKLVSEMNPESQLMIYDGAICALRNVAVSINILLKPEQII